LLAVLMLLAFLLLMAVFLLLESLLILASNVNDIENEPSILANFLYRSETNLAYSRTCKDQSQANPVYSTP
jgi:hypothetical protein